MSWVAPDKGQAFGHALKGGLGASYRGHPLGSDPEESLRTSATFWGRVAAVRLHISLRLQAVQSSVDCTDRYLALGTKFDFLAHRNPVGSIVQTKKGQDNDVLEFTEVIAAGHYLYNIDEIVASQIAAL
jgi:hypothetical protein